MHRVTLGRVLHEDLHYAFDIRRDEVEEDRSDEEQTLLAKLVEGPEMELTDGEARELVAEVINRSDMDDSGPAWQRGANRLYFDLGLLEPLDPRAVRTGRAHPITIQGERYEWKGWA